MFKLYSFCNFFFTHVTLEKRYYDDDKGELVESCKIKRAVPQTTMIILLCLCIIICVLSVEIVIKRY